jgi:aldehyde dehydrogenase (NAD+)
MGNRVVVVPSPVQPLSATDFYQVLDTSDVPGGVVSIVTGARAELSKTLADHDEVDALWYAAPRSEWAAVELASAGNLKPVWTLEGDRTDWQATTTGQGPRFLRHATQLKTIWVPYGE